MNTVRKRWLAGLGIAALLSVAACAGGSSAEPSAPDTPAPGQNNVYKLDSNFAYWQDVPEEMGGGRVLCLWARYDNAGGNSCDWEGYHKKYGYKQS